MRLPVRFLPSIVWLVRLVVGAYPRWIGSAPSANQRIYFANHSSHMDTIVLWAALPHSLRVNTRPVAARDYWGGGGLRTQIAREELNVVMIDRWRPPTLAGTAGDDRSDSTDSGDSTNAGEANTDPLEPLCDALVHGFSLIIFPEGTRTPQPLPSAFKSGLFHLATGFPDVELIPVYLDNLHRSLPKGALLPVPIISTVRFGAPLPRLAGESKDAFLERARAAVIALASG